MSVDPNQTAPELESALFGGGGNLVSSTIKAPGIGVLRIIQRLFSYFSTKTYVVTPH